MKAKVLCAIGLMALFLGVQNASAATVRMQLTDGTTTVTIFDQGAVPLDTNPAVGIVNWSGSVGLWTVTVAAGTGENQLLTGPGGMDLTYNVSSVGIGSNPTTLTMLFTQFGMTPSYPGWALNIGGTNNLGGAPVRYDAFYDNSNTPFGLANQIDGTLGPFSASNYGASTSGAAGDIPPYALTQRLRFTAGTSSGGNTGDASLIPVPEPGSMLLLGTGLFGLAAAARRKLRKG